VGITVGAGAHPRGGGSSWMSRSLIASPRASGRGRSPSRSRSPCTLAYASARALTDTRPHDRGGPRTARVAWPRRWSSTMALRETFEGLELVVDTMAQHRPQQARAGEPNGLEMREAGALALWDGRHPHGEEPPLHDAPPGPEHRVDAHANPEVRSDLDPQTVVVALEDGERSDVPLPLRRPMLEVARDSPDTVEGCSEHTLPERRMRQAGNQDPHPAHRIELCRWPRSGHRAHGVH